MYKAQEVGPDHPLHQMTARLAQRANLLLPKVYVIPTPSPNAFATGRNPQRTAVAAMEGIIRLLDDRELEGLRWVRWAGRPSGIEPDRAACDDHPDAAGRAVDPGGHLAVARVRGGPGGGRDRGRPARPGRCTAQDRRCGAPRAVECEPGDVKPFSSRGMMALFSTHPATEQRIWRLLQPA